MLKRHALLLAATTMLAACTSNQITVVAPPKTAEEKAAATTYAEQIYPVVHGQRFTKLREDFMKSGADRSIKEKITGDLSKTSFGTCLNSYGFGDYIVERILSSLSPEKLHEETIKLWVTQIPNESFKKLSQTFTEPKFKKLWLRLRSMENNDMRTKLDILLKQKEITESEANGFLLTLGDKDLMAFAILADADMKIATENALAPVAKNPAPVILDFMHSHPEADKKCSLLKNQTL